MQDFDQDSLERLQAATAGIDLTSGEQKTLKWISGWETATVDNVAHIIEKAKGTEKAGELTQDDLFKLWGFLETLKNIFEEEIRCAASIEDATIRGTLTTNNTKWAAEIRELQQKLNREAGEE